MKSQDMEQLVDKAVQQLGNLVGEKPVVSVGARSNQYGDAEVRFGNQPTGFLLEFKSRSDAATIALAVNQAKRHMPELTGVVPVIAVPYMGTTSRRLCEDAGLSWFDLSGNAHLDFPGLHIHIEGKPNSYVRRGRPSSVFAPKSARIARWFLMHPSESFSQHYLAGATGMSKGFVSKIVRRLEELNLVESKGQGALRLRDFNALLEAWAEAYDFSRHRIVRGHVAARTGDAVLRQLASAFEDAHLPYAATGLCAAWQYSAFAGFRLVALYVGQQPDPDVLKNVGFHEETAGENVWIVAPNDEGVFHGAQHQKGIRCVHPVQVYLDLLKHPERSSEAAQRLRDEYLKGKNDA